MLVSNIAEGFANVTFLEELEENHLVTSELLRHTPDLPPQPSLSSVTCRNLGLQH
jgi:hypothetical protein